MSNAGRKYDARRYSLIRLDNLQNIRLKKFLKAHPAGADNKRFCPGETFLKLLQAGYLSYLARAFYFNCRQAAAFTQYKIHFLIAIAPIIGLYIFSLYSIH